MRRVVGSVLRCRPVLLSRSATSAGAAERRPGLRARLRGERGPQRREPGAVRARGDTRPRRRCRFSDPAIERASALRQSAGSGAGTHGYVSTNRAPPLRARASRLPRRHAPRRSRCRAGTARPRSCCARPRRHTRSRSHRLAAPQTGAAAGANSHAAPHPRRRAIRCCAFRTARDRRHRRHRQHRSLDHRTPTLLRRRTAARRMRSRSSACAPARSCVCPRRDHRRLRHQSGAHAERRASSFVTVSPELLARPTGAPRGDRDLARQLHGLRQDAGARPAGFDGKVTGRSMSRATPR
jgi:hypothetical protein